MGSSAVSLKAALQEAGGLLDDVDVICASHRFVMWDYDGKQGVAAKPFLRVVMYPVVDGVIDQEAAVNQYYSAGDEKFFEPSEDGMRLLNKPGYTKQGLNKTTNAALYLRSIQDASFPDEKVENSVDVFDGMYAHAKRIAQPKRSNAVVKPGQQQDREQTVLLIDEIKALPWEKDKMPKGPAAKSGAPAVKKATGAPSVAKAAATVAKPAAKAAPAAPAVSASDMAEELIDKAQGPLLEALIGDKYPDGIPKAKVSTIVYNALKSDKDVKKIMAFATKEEFLSGEDRPWVFDGDVLRAVAEEGGEEEATAE